MHRGPGRVADITGAAGAGGARPCSLARKPAPLHRLPIAVRSERPRGERASPVPFRSMVLRAGAGRTLGAACLRGHRSREHKWLHQIAARLLRGAATNAPMAREDYDDLVSGRQRLFRELDSLRDGIAWSVAGPRCADRAYGRAEMLPALREWRELADETCNVARSRSWTWTISRRSTTRTVMPPAMRCWPAWYITRNT